MREELARILKEFSADSGTIHLMGGDGLLHLKASIGIPDQVLTFINAIPVGKGMAGLAAERREPVTICNLQSDTSGDARPGAKATGLEGSIALPIFDGDRVAGVLGVANLAPRTFTPAEIDRLLEEGRRLAAHSA
ncbi:MAG: GAF domain-containing protein [Acidimicrobiia bacterium]|nr:GAF domain-containing protein [Acidimicrobiia bacterium]